eukprot:403349657
MDKQLRGQANLGLDTNNNGSGKGGLVLIRTKDNKTMQLEQRIAFQSFLLRSMIEDRQQSNEDDEQNDDQEVIPLPQFDEKILLKVFEFMRYEYENESLPELPRPLPTDRLQDSMPQWFANYINNVGCLEDVYDVIAAANYLDIPTLLELGCAKVGSMMKNKTIPDLRKMFIITNDFTPEEERTILEGKADIWGDEDDEGDDQEQTVQNTQKHR